jgi:hypothetical protein
MCAELNNTGGNPKKNQGGGFQIQDTNIRLNSESIWLCENNTKPFSFFYIRVLLADNERGGMINPSIKDFSQFCRVSFYKGRLLLLVLLHLLF